MIWFTFVAEGLFPNDGDCTNWTCRTAADFQWESDEFETSFADKCLSIPEAFYVRDTSLSTGKVSFEVGFALWGGADGFDAKGNDPFVREPMHR